jgi:flagellar protein FlgJ
MAASNLNAANAVTDFGQYTGLKAAAQRKDPAALHKAAQQFEALFTEMMLKAAHQTQFGDDLTGPQGDVYKDLFDQQLAVQMSSGKGMGLADLLVRQLGGAAGAPSPAQARNPAAAGSSDGTSAVSPHWKPKSAQEFVDAVRPEAEKAAAELGVPARALIAQAALETGWGQHLARGKDGAHGFNLFGVKAQGGWSGASSEHLTGEYQNGQWTQQRDSFRAYGSIGAAFQDYVQFLKGNPRYAAALRSGDVHGFAHGLQQAGYATDPNYAQKLVKVAYGAEMAGAYDARNIASA